LKNSERKGASGKKRDLRTKIPQVPVVEGQGEKVGFFKGKGAEDMEEIRRGRAM